MPREFRNYDEFFAHYLREHSAPANRRLHAAGTLLGLTALAFVLVTGRYWLVPLCFVPGYAFAWIGHFAVEKNKPATFGNPLWSFLSDLRMFGLMVTGRLDEELAKAEESDPAQPAA